MRFAHLWIVVIVFLLACYAAGCQQNLVHVYAPTYVFEGSTYRKTVEVHASDGKQMSDLVDADVKVPLTP